MCMMGDVHCSSPGVRLTADAMKTEWMILRDCKNVTRLSGASEVSLCLNWLCIYPYRAFLYAVSASKARESVFRGKNARTSLQSRVFLEIDLIVRLRVLLQNIHYDKFDY